MNVQIIKCFVASPSDTAEERAACDDVFTQINAELGDLYKIRIESVKWEKDAYPDFGSDGQDVLNKQLRPGDHPFFVGIISHRFGTATARAESGTEEEFDQAFAKWSDDSNATNIQIYFNGKPPEDIGAIDCDQLTKIRKFKEKVVAGGGLYNQYKGADDFRNLLRSNIIKSLNAKYSRPVPAEGKVDDVYTIKLAYLENKLKYALQSYKGQPEVFIEPSLSDSREIDDEKNVLDSIIESPCDAFIIAPPQFGLTCLSLYMRTRAYKNRKFWIHIDASHAKSRLILRSVEEQLHEFGELSADLQCVLIDGWDSKNAEHIKISRNINEQYPAVPLILFTNDGGLIDPRAALKLDKRNFRSLHLQALSRNKIRRLLEGYSPSEGQASHDQLLCHVTSHLESINIHRTPLNCLTLLRVNGSDYNEKLLNKAKLMKAILFVLFTDYESFSYSDSRPDVDECVYVLGKFCKNLIHESSLAFDALDFRQKLEETCRDGLISLKIDSMLDVLIDNNILINRGTQYEFKHRFWVFYFAAEWMTRDTEFRGYILENQRYTNFPELIDFYTGIDGQKVDALEAILRDLEVLTQKVDKKIGIGGEFNPLSDFLWNPPEHFIEKTRQEIADKVESSNLPAEIKDKHADKNYDSNAPYDQSIKNFLSDYSVLSLKGSIAAASRALRNSTFVAPELKIQAAESIIKAWEEISKVVFWISPILAKDGQAAHEGLAFILADTFSEDLNKRFQQILMANPKNVVGLLKDDLSSRKIGVVLYKLLGVTKSELRMHLIILFIIDVRPEGWYNVVFDHLNRLHPSSFYLCDLLGKLRSEISLGYIDNDSEVELKNLLKVILAKRRYASKSVIAMEEKIKPSLMFSDEHKLPIDKIFANDDPSSPDKYGRSMS